VRPYDNTTSTRVDSGIGERERARKGVSQDDGMRRKRARARARLLERESERERGEGGRVEER